MSIISAFKKLIAALRSSSKSVDSILNEHRRTIEALNARSSDMVNRGRDIEDEIAKKREQLEKALLERKRADAAAVAMNKVFGAADEVAL